MGVWRTDRAVIGEITRRRGYLLNIASLSAIAHAPLMGAYTTAKSGVEALSDALRMETAPTGARVGCAYFGFIDTDLVRASFALPTTKRLNESLPELPGQAGAPRQRRSTRSSAASIGAPSASTRLAGSPPPGCCAASPSR